MSTILVFIIWVRSYERMYNNTIVLSHRVALNCHVNASPANFVSIVTKHVQSSNSTPTKHYGGWHHCHTQVIHTTNVHHMLDAMHIYFHRMWHKKVSYLFWQTGLWTENQGDLESSALGPPCLDLISINELVHNCTSVPLHITPTSKVFYTSTRHKWTTMRQKLWTRWW